MPRSTGLWGLSEVTGGRPLFFSWRTGGGSRSSEPFGLELMAERLMALSRIEGLVEENAERAKLPMDTALKIPGREAWNERKVP
jgi:hypothetical protein